MNSYFSFTSVLILIILFSSLSIFLGLGFNLPLF